MILLIHAEWVIELTIAIYAAVAIGWTLVCYFAIRAWLNRKKKKREQK